MANIKITELNGITKKASDDVLAIVDVSANETKKIAVEDLLDKNIELIAVSDTEPAECSYGDKYFNTTDNLIYTAIATDTWSEDGEEPIEGIFYVVFGEQSSYAYNGTTLISVGGGTEDIIISPDQPTSEDWKLWIDSGEVINSGSEVVDSLEGNETNKAPSVHAVNGIIESGSNANGSWTKFADGTLIITQKVEITNMPIATSWGTWYMTDRGINPPDFPVNFIEKPCVSLSFGSTTSTAIASLTDDTYVNNAGGFRLFRGSTSTGVSGITFITAIGRWK
jgi:hypothetical protein